ncbi:MAG: zinc ribbon domain-containing protein [Faecalimonas sp.]|nr:zinc ribbon domain-containing protein [Faecalimonas sp.]
MSMINCPECNKEISDKALVCPNCGYPLSNNISNADFFIKKKCLAEDLGFRVWLWEF